MQGLRLGIVKTIIQRELRQFSSFSPNFIESFICIIRIFNCLIDIDTYHHPWSVPFFLVGFFILGHFHFFSFLFLLFLLCLFLLFLQKSWLLNENVWWDPPSPTFLGAFFSCNPTRAPLLLLLPIDPSQFHHPSYKNMV